MSEIKRPITFKREAENIQTLRLMVMDEDAHWEDPGIVDTATEDDLRAAGYVKIAQPNAGDVEALAQYIADEATATVVPAATKHAISKVVQEGIRRAAPHFAAHEAQLRGCVKELLEFVGPVLPVREVIEPEITFAHARNAMVRRAESALATPPSDAGDKYLVTKKYVTIVRQILSGIRLYRGKMNGANYLETLAKGLEAEPTPAVVIQPTAPDAGDVEARYAEDHGLDPDAERYASLLKSLDAAEKREREATAREAQLRGALEQARPFVEQVLFSSQTTDSNDPCGTFVLPEELQEYRAVLARIDVALATPPSEAAQRVLAVIEGIRALSRDTTRKVHPAWEQIDNALCTLDGKDGASDGR